MGKSKKVKNKQKSKKIRTNIIESHTDINTNVPSFSIFNGVLKFLVDIAAIITAIVAIITVHEMQADRNAAHQPLILMNPVEYNISWDQDGHGEWLLEHTDADEGVTDIKKNEDGSYSAKIGLSFNILYDGFEQFSAVNAGVGIAHDIVFTWSSDNIIQLNDYLIRFDKTKEGFAKVGKSIVFDYEDRSVMTDVPSDVALMYMLPNADETYMLPLPQAYYILLHEIIQTHSYDSEIPELWLTVEYYDIQGNKYISPIIVQPKVTYFYEDNTGAGTASFQLIPIHPRSIIKEGT